MTSPQSLNLYAYVRNNPIDFKDPSGLLLSSSGGACFIRLTQHYEYKDGQIVLITDSVEFFCIGGGGGSPIGGGSGGGAGGGTDNPPPPKVKKANPGQQKQFNNAWKELLSRLDNEDCAKIFGGKEKALELLSHLQFSVEKFKKEDIGVAADIEGNKVRFNRDGDFFSETGAKAYVRIEQSEESELGIGSINLASNEFGAFTILHELGHKAGIYGDSDDDNAYLLNGPNNNTIIKDACFSEKKVKPQKGLPPPR